MNPFILRIAEFFGMFNKIRNWFKGKKTKISAIGGMLGSGGTIIVILLSWIDGKMDTVQFLDSIKLPIGAFWVSATFLFAANHPKNVKEAEIIKHRLGPGL